MSSTSPEHGIVQPILDAIGSWVKEYRQAIGLRGELANFREEEVAFIAKDMGITPQELLFAVSKGPHAADELPKLLSALGVDSAKACVRKPRQNARLATHLHHLQPQRAVPPQSCRRNSRWPLPVFLSERGVA